MEVTIAAFVIAMLITLLLRNASYLVQTVTGLWTATNRFIFFLFAASTVEASKLAVL